MSADACAELVARGDPDRFMAVMAAPAAARPALFTLYAFNLEIARAPWVTAETMIAEMRLQWWREVVANAASGAARAHEVAGPLHDLIRRTDLPLAVLDSLIAARVWDVHGEPHDGDAALDRYLEDTGAGLMWLAARALGAPDAAEGTVRAYGWAHGLAGYLRAVPALVARGRKPLVRDDPAGLAGLARRGLDRLAQARHGRADLPSFACPALLAGWQTGAVLRRAASRPALILSGGLAPSEFRKRGTLLWQAATGLW